MRVLPSLIAAIFAGSALAKKPPVNVYDKYAKKQASNTPLDIDSKIYSELTATPRDYSVVVLLTALDAKYSCAMCKEFDSEWKTLARSWQKGDKKKRSRMIFGTLDFDRGRDTFMQTAPVLMLWPATTGPDASPDASAIRYDFLGPQTAESVHSWITRQLPGEDFPPLVRPVNYARIVTTITVVTGLFTFGTVAYPYLLPIVQNRNVWAAVSLILVLLFTSGHMYNHIRKVPYVTGNSKGGITYFAGGFGNQFGIETQIVAAMYAVLSFALIALALKVPRMKDSRAQQVACIIWVSVLFGVYSFLMSVFRVKNGGYPFWIPPF